VYVKARPRSKCGVCDLKGKYNVLLERYQKACRRFIGGCVFMGAMFLGGQMKLELHDLTVSYNRHPAIHHVSGVFAGGSLTAIAGPNGAGKSTLLKAIAGIMKPSTGKIVLDGFKPADIAYLPQAAEIARDFPLTVLQLAVTGYWAQKGASGKISQELQDKAKYALASVGLTEFENRSLASLSAGQFQRLLFARLILQDAKIILLDEPFTAIDGETMSKLLEIIHNWHGEGRTVICVLHDLRQIRDHFPECVLLARKCVAWGETKTVLQNENLFSAKLFHEAWREDAEVCEA